MSITWKVTQLLAQEHGLPYDEDVAFKSALTQDEIEAEIALMHKADPAKKTLLEYSEDELEVMILNIVMARYRKFLNITLN